MISERSPISQEIYESFLLALKNLGNAEALANSPLISSCLVTSYIKNNFHSSPSEALRAVLTKLLALLEVGSNTHAKLLHARFWEGKTLKEIRESTDYNPLDLSMRTIQENQRTGIYKLAAWFQEKEKACQQTKSDSDTQNRREKEDPPFSELLESVTTFAHPQPTFSTNVTENFQQAAIGNVPKVWGKYGGANITPTIQLSKGTGRTKQVLEFPKLRDEYANKDLIYKSLRLIPPYEIKTQLAFQNEPADRAGIVLGWQNRSQLIRIQANLYWNHVSYWEKGNGMTTQRHTVQLPEVIEVGTPYWLAVQTGINHNEERFVIVSWAANEQELVPIMSIQNVQHPLTGYVGLSTSGPNLPHVHFHALHIAT